MEKIKLPIKELIIAFILMFAGGAFGSYILADITFSHSYEYGFIDYILILAGLVLAVWFSIITHELGHLFYGRLTGYSFVSFRIGSLMLIKNKDGFRVKRFTLKGTGGQCLMTPQCSENKNIPYALFNLGGVLFNLFFTGVFFIIFVLFNNVPVLSQIVIIFALISLFSAILNGVPLSVEGIDNDGANVRSLYKSKKARRAFAIQLMINAELSKGTSITDMPKEWFELPSDSDLDNALVATLAVFHMNRLLAERRFDECRALIRKYLEKKTAMLGIHRSLLMLDAIYIDLITQGDVADVSSFYTAEMTNLMKAMKSFPSVQRTRYAVALIKDKNENMAENIKQSFEKTAKSYPYESDAICERGLMDIALHTYLEGRG